jgi:hypothetical protein
MVHEALIVCYDGVGRIPEIATKYAFSPSEFPNKSK